MASLTNEQYALMKKAHALFSDPALVAAFKTRSGLSMKPISDGHHSFNDLYAHRRKLSAIIFALAGHYAWKSHQHADGTMFNGDFIVGVSIPDIGDYSYHYKNQYWDEFQVPEVKTAPPYDGHRPEDIDRLLALIPLLTKRTHVTEPKNI